MNTDYPVCKFKLDGCDVVVSNVAKSGRVLVLVGDIKGKLRYFNKYYGTQYKEKYVFTVFKELLVRIIPDVTLFDILEQKITGAYNILDDMEN